MQAQTSILVVDDQLDLMDYVVRVLASEGYQVLTADNGYAALDVLEHHPVNLILADIAMPRMNGYQLYEQVCANPQWVTIPVLFMTARSLDSDIRYGKELGVDGYLIKPVDVDDLLAAVRGRLRRARQLARVMAPPANDAASHTFGAIRIDLRQHLVWKNDRKIKLSAKEFTLLEHLARQPDNVVPLKVLIQITHNLNTDSIEAGTLLRPLIRSLRRKMGYRAGQMGCIENVRGIGYKFVTQSDV